MSPTTARMLRMVLSAIVAGLMGAGSVVLGSVSAEGQVKPGVWMIAGVSGVMFACKDVQAYLAQGPIQPPQVEVPAQPRR